MKYLATPKQQFTRPQPRLALDVFYEQRKEGEEEIVTNATLPLPDHHLQPQSQI